ncbi:3-oxoacyl-[acyl-carrier-protein] reductase FabG [Papilio machaon]|uniref:3-oxoacyl-[acyl-carrier-protein] reductase FabG n=1 Tax=Papilio machaon TaxID=76193 RepID=A0A0N1IFH9_PAPMA|nr:3-oxoacyl-[acyl-carrier-protein] reductase FabG [Papilio machaon]
MSFTGKVVIVTGSSSGIGAAAAIEFAKEGASVVIVGRNETKLKSVNEECEKLGKKPLVLKVDVSNEVEAKSVIDKTVEHFGKLDILVNNAGVGYNFDIVNDGFMENFDNVMNLNLRAAAYLTHLATPHLIQTKGNIINISSVAGTSAAGGSVGLISYCTSKAALNHFSRCIAARLASYGIRANVISPGPVRTDILENSKSPLSWDIYKEATVLKRVSEPKEVADLILFLASDKAKGITGSEYIVDNGYLIN